MEPNIPAGIGRPWSARWRRRFPFLNRIKYLRGPARPYAARSRLSYRDRATGKANFLVPGRHMDWGDFSGPRSTAQSGSDRRCLIGELPHHFLQNSGQIVFQLPVGKMAVDLGQIRDVADVVSDAVCRVVLVVQWMTHLLEKANGFQNRNTVSSASAEVVNLAAPRVLVELEEQPPHITAMDLIAHLFALVAENGVGFAGHGAHDDVRQVAMQFHGRMLRASQAPSAETSDRHAKVPPELLANHIGRDLGGPKHRV